MPWTRPILKRAGKRSAGVLPAGARTACPHTRRLAALALILVSALSLVSAAPEKHLSVYSVAANYSLPLVQNDGRDYVGLLELLEPLGRGQRQVRRFRTGACATTTSESNFQAGKTRAQVLGRDADLGAKFLLENNRGLVPVASLSSLLPRFLGGPVTLREESDRLFIGSVATHFTASLSGDNPPRLVLHFSAPVNPSIATEPGALRMTFSREPLVPPASPTLTFGSKAISSATYSEDNGAAVLTVHASHPGNRQLRKRWPHHRHRPDPGRRAEYSTHPRPQRRLHCAVRGHTAATSPTSPPRALAAILPSSTPATAAMIPEKLSAAASWKRM